MPAFTFEKISPPQRGSYPARSHPQPKPPSHQPVNVIQVLGRFVEARVRDDQHNGQTPPRRPLPK